MTREKSSSRSSSQSRRPKSQPQLLKVIKVDKPQAKYQPQDTTAAASSKELPDSGMGSREWWAQRWIDVLESFGWRRRLERARIYAREGKVLSLAFQGPQVVAKVQGTAPEPYDVSLSLDPFSNEQWGYVIEEMSQRAIFAAKLLAGEMPQNIEEAFTAAGLSLFPFSKFDIHSKCSCPDPVNPCKHIGAVYYVLGDHFSQDPFILFQLRGRTKRQTIEALRQVRSTHTQAAPETAQTAAIRFTPPKLDQQFWEYKAQLDASLVVIAPPPGSETVLDVLGDIPLEPQPANGVPTTSQAAMETLRQIYARVAQQALITAMKSGEAE